MELGAKIKYLRNHAGLTQEQLAGRLGVSAQSVSKWETAVSMPDILLLPALAGELGVTVDDLFDLSVEQKLCRIEKRMDIEEEFPPDLFREYEEFLQTRLSEDGDQTRLLRLLAHLYHHRMEADARRVSRYAREAIRREPHRKDCQWLLSKAEGQCRWDWNMDNHAASIEFYREVINGDRGEPPSPLPYYYLLDNLIADHRTGEAAATLEKYAALPGHKKFMTAVYRAHIALAGYDEKTADGIMEDAAVEFGENSGFLFEAAQYYARKCEYEKAVLFYERSWQAEENQKPRFTDALDGIAAIYRILGEKEKAVQTYDRILRALREEWGCQADDAAVLETERKKHSLLAQA